MAKDFDLFIYTPERMFYNSKITALNIKIANGSIGLLADHIPLISSIKTSVFSIEGKKDKRKEGVIIGGILFFENNQAKIFTSKIIWKENVNVSNLKSKIDFYQKELARTDLSNYEQKTLQKSLDFYNLQES